MVSYKKGQRELFWDDFNINKSLTTAEVKMHEPRIEEIVFTFDAPWEGDGCNYFEVIEPAKAGITVTKKFRFYYFAWKMYDKDLKQHMVNTIYLCMLESDDGIHWERPDLGLYEYEGSTHNNIIMTAADDEVGSLDNFVIFIDDNPECKKDEVFKATAGGDNKLPDGTREPKLFCYTSPDGLHWKKGWLISDKNKYDSQNVAFWDKDAGEYKLYVRDFHGYVGDWVGNGGVRDIRLQTSKDFKTWSDAELIDFKGSEDIPLYTNAVRKYERAGNMYVGFPSRYMERLEWEPNYDELAGSEWRKVRTGISPRYGLAITDCALMISRDGFSWDRFDDAWMKPGIERKWNWVYGDCYPSVGFIETESGFEFAPAEYSIFCSEKHWSNEPAKLRRYTFRKDGLVSRHASYKGGKVVTQPFMFEGDTLKVNFSTSARGYIIVKAYAKNLTDGHKYDVLTSCEIFGDNLERTVIFDKPLSAFSGRETFLEFEMKEAELYSMVIE